MNNIFVGNLSFQATKEDLIKLFEPFGQVASAVIMERKKGKSRGYGFIDMPNEEEKNAAIAGLAGKEFMWRVLSVSQVVPKVRTEAKTRKYNSPKKEWKSKEGQAIAKPAGESKYYSKFDGPPKPWRKGTADPRPVRRDDKGSRPYYGKKENDKKSVPGSYKTSYKRSSDQSKSTPKHEEVSKYSNKPKASKGFKMFHKVSGASKSRPKVPEMKDRKNSI